MAQLLGTSLKSIQRFEQGWRNIPVYIERHVLLLTALKRLDEELGNGFAEATDQYYEEIRAKSIPSRRGSAEAAIRKIRR
jgi:hypothetical protein